MDEGDGAGYAYYLVALRIGHKVILPTRLLSTTAKSENFMEIGHEQIKAAPG